jgi:hypothetical protein
MSVVLAMGAVGQPKDLAAVLKLIDGLFSKIRESGRMVCDARGAQSMGTESARGRASICRMHRIVLIACLCHFAIGASTAADHR